MKIKNLLFTTVLLMLTGISASSQHTYKPKSGYVPDEKTAIRIAEAVLIPIYGEEQIRSEEPFKANLVNRTVWIVTGSIAPGIEGGVAEVKISKQSGTILGVTHGK